MSLRNTLAGALLATLGLVSAADARDLTIVSWGGAYQDIQRDIYFRPFQQQTGIRILEESWDGGVGVLRAKMQSGSNNWDVVQVESEELLLGCEEGLFEKLDFSRIGGRDRYIPDAVHDCGVGTILYTNILAWDRDKLQGTPTWADFFAPDRIPGKRGMRRGVKLTLEQALIGDGVPLAEVYKVLATDAGVDRAFRVLDRIKPDIVWWSASAQGPQILGSGEVVLTSSYNGRITSANWTEKRNFGIQWQGSLFTIDSWVIMKGSPNTESAYRFIDFAGDPKRQGQMLPRIPYGGTARGANDGAPPDLLALSPSYPANLEAGIKVDDQFWLDNLDRLTTRFNAWMAR